MRGLEIGVIGPHDEARAGGDRRRLRGARVLPGVLRARGPGHRQPERRFALWLTREGHLPADYVARQGTAMGRDGRVAVRTDDAGDIWVGGACRTLVEGSLTL